MPRPRSLAVKTVKQLVREQRGELYASGHQNLNMVLPGDLIERIDAWKRRYRLGSRDAVVARVIRQCMATTSPDAFILHARTRPTEIRRISPIVAAELADYVRLIQDRFHGMAYGPVFEMIAGRVGADLSEVRVTTVDVEREHPPVPALST
ncbi:MULTISPECIES: hypothetical protein [unclassified Sphingomonas]|uniref:hypothetical protein n=1 Tax=unclassified Sphingomonas TaxID=196159 RepID=UPI002269EF8C|nr:MULTISPECIES: hypothetical protein [unclassified Sphingomonas]